MSTSPPQEPPESSGAGRLAARLARAAGGSEPLRYLIAGGWNTLFSCGSISLLYYLFSSVVHYTVILVVSTVLNITMGYCSYKFFVFRTKGNYLREYLRFYVVCAFPIALNFTLLPLLIEVFHMNAYLAIGIVTAIALANGYLGHKHISFRKPG